jgi:dipeptide transport system ATP-binding protein
LLSLRGLDVRFGRGPAAVRAVEGLDLDVAAGEVLGIVGESGSGKSVAMLAAMGLIDPPGQVDAAAMRFDGIDLLTISPRERRRRVSPRIAMVFQDPVASLDPCWTVGAQLTEVLGRRHPGPCCARGRSSCSVRWRFPTRRPGWTATRTRCPAACVSG